MSLFNDLLRLQGGQTSTEDFFTEIVAYLLQVTDDLLQTWIDHLEILDSSDYLDFRVSTQISYDEGRPDIMIELETEDSSDVIFIESKLGAQEGQEQLTRYAKALAGRSHVRNRVLLYITKKYDPKDADLILKDLPPITFKQLRWHEFYRFLRTRPVDSLIEAVCRFMEERGMAQTNLITPTDVLTMKNLPQVFSLMNETLFGEVSQRFKEIVGSVSTKRRSRRELSNDRYILISQATAGRNIWFGLGYWFHGVDYPVVGAELAMYPNAPEQDQILSMMKELSQRDEWEGYKLNQPKKWSNIKKQRPINRFLSGDDHLDELKSYFFELLDEFAEIKDRYPHLSWRKPGAENEAEDEEG